MYIKLRKVAPTARVPEYATIGSVGMDLYATAGITIAPGETKILDMGFSLEIPRNNEGQIRSRSSTALRGLVVANAPGTIDPDYRGEVKVILRNISNIDQIVSRGDRVAQLVIAPVVRATWEVVEHELTETDRGTGGLGSTGT